MPKILAGELVIIEYVNGGFVNRWGVIGDISGVQAGDGRKAAAGFVDLLHEGAAGSLIINNRANIASGGLGNVAKYLTDCGFRKQPFSGKDLTVLKLVNSTDRFNASGAKIGTLPAGAEIGIETGAAGNSNRHLMSVNAYNDGSGWKFIDETNYTYGFVNVQQGFGLKMYNSVRSIETAENVVLNPDINWTAIASGIASTNLEPALRGVTDAEDKAAIIQNINDYFAVKDLGAAKLGDGSLFFNNAKNSSFVSRNLASQGLTSDQAKFEAEKQHFYDLFTN